MALQVWLHAFCPDTILHPETVISYLDRSGVTANILHPDVSSGPGIIILDGITSEICDFVHTVSENGIKRILVLAANSDGLVNDDAWQILQAGASDILVWSKLSDPGSVIAARIRRWHDLDELIASPLVHNNLVGQSRAWKSVISQIVELARFTDAPVLLVGETGTGKELAARLIHTLDEQRSRHELVILDCTTIVPDLSGSELFGHERGAFTGAVSARDGAFALADGGTLFLDEVGELPLGLQVQLLRVLQEHSYKRVGSNTWRQSNFRLVCATNRDLLVEEVNGRFRRDLYYRIASWTIRLPPLRERVSDILLLVNHFIRQLRPDQEQPELDDSVKAYFISREYPGNVRDLKNLVFRIVARHAGPGPITLGDIPLDERPNAGFNSTKWCDVTIEQAIRRALAAGARLKEIGHAVEETAIRICVDDENGNLQRAANKLGVTDRTLQKWRAQERQRVQELSNGRRDP